jgi:hypothetical protein
MAAEDTTQSIFQPYLKSMWHKGRIVDLTMRDKPVLSMLANPQDFFGDDQKINLKHRNPMGRSANSVKAQANARSGRGVRFNSTRVSNHQSVFVSNEVMEASSNDMGALVSAIDDQMEGAVENLVNEVSFGIFRSGGGTRAQQTAAPTVPGGGAQDYLTVSLRSTRFIEVGMTLKSGTTDGTTATTFRSTPATAEVAGVDRDNDLIYFAAGTFTGTNWASGDYLSVDGDIDESTFLGKYITGFAGWIPRTRTQAVLDNFKGVNRFQDPTRLAGTYYDAVAKGQSPENAIIYCAGIVGDAGGKPDIVAMSSRRWTDIAINLGSRVVYQDLNGKGDTAALTFRSIVLPAAGGNGGNVKLVADPSCQDDDLWMLELESWKWHTLKDWPRINIHNGNKMLDPGTATDDVELRWVYRGNLECNAPGHNARIRVA